MMASITQRNETQIKVQAYSGVRLKQEYLRLLHKLWDAGADMALASEYMLDKMATWATDEIAEQAIGHGEVLSSCLPPTELTSPEFFRHIPAFPSVASENPSFESFSHA